MSGIDEVDLAILKALQEDGRLSNAKLSEQMHLSETPCWRRVRQLESSGYIEDYQANLNLDKLGWKIHAFVLVRFESHTANAFGLFEEVIQNSSHVLLCHRITGEADYLLQVIAVDLDDYRNFVDSVLRKLTGIATVQTNISLQKIKSTHRIPMPLKAQVG